jgi:putative DNA methylase
MHKIVPFSLKNATALIERLLPVQKLSAEVYKERMAGSGQSLTALGSYWKGRKPLILSKACVLGCLLPATSNGQRDLEIFELLMGMDLESLDKRLEAKNDKASRFILAEESTVSQAAPYREWVQASSRPEECGEEIFEHIWFQVNEHLGTNAHSFPELVEQLGVMRFGHRPLVADTFSGSGQIPFEAARLGCDVYASDLNPVACMLTWGAFHIVGASKDERERLVLEQQGLVQHVQKEIEALGIESDGDVGRSKVYFYCLEARCPQTGWMVPLLPRSEVNGKFTSAFVISKGYRVVAELVPDTVNRCYQIEVRSAVSEAEIDEASRRGTVRTDGRGQDPYLLHTVDGKEYRTKISTLRGDYRAPDGMTANRLRLWEKTDFKPRPDDIYQERLYCVQWMMPKKRGTGYDYEFRTVTPQDIERERLVESIVAQNIEEWQEKGWIPDMRIEPGAETTRLFRERGWTHWHHLFNPRQLLMLELVNQGASPVAKFLTVTLADQCSRLSRWNGSASKGAGGNTSNTFDNQALNTLFNYGHRAVANCSSFLRPNWKQYPLETSVIKRVACTEAAAVNQGVDIFVTDPPYGDAVNYHEILEFFIAWLRKNPPVEFRNWIWDSRRSLAIKGEDEDFRRGMIAAYKRMAECMSDNGIQVIMFTHQSGSIWADMSNIVWASGLQVTAAWYVVTETDSALREGSYVKGTVLLVLRKRQGSHKVSRDDLAWEIQEEVEEQVASLTGLNQQAKGLYRDENVFEDADIQMAGYAAALRVLTRYATIDGRDMTSEAMRPRVKGEKTFVDGLIEFAVATANQCLVPSGIEKSHWDKLSSAERFYLKMLDLEARGAKTLDNYQNFAKAFKVRDFNAFLESSKANSTRLKSAAEFGRAEMGESSDFYGSVLRASLYAMMELGNNVDGDEVLAHLRLNVPNYYGDSTQRDLVVELAGYMAKQLESIRPEEASAARVLRELMKNERLG